MAFGLSGEEDRSRFAHSHRHNHHQSHHCCHENHCFDPWDCISPYYCLTPGWSGAMSQSLGWITSKMIQKMIMLTMIIHQSNQE